MKHLVDKELYGKCLLEIAKLPQAKFLLRENIDSWLDAMYANDPDRIMWHIKRLNGFGGSEMGHLVADEFDEYDMFGSPREVVASKLMMKLPDPPSGDTERGTYMEDHIRNTFRKKFNATGMDEAMDKMQNYRSAAHPWLVGNTDDYVQIGGRFYVTDYKCPRQVSLDKQGNPEVKFDYYAQLHHYALILKDLGYPVDGLLLAQFDMVTWGIHVSQVQINQNMYDSILKNGDRLWNEYVMRATLPHWKESTVKIDVQGSRLKDESKDRIAVLATELTSLIPLANEAAKRVKDIKEEVNDLLHETYIGEPKLVSGVVDITVKEALSSEKVEEYVKKHNLDINEFMKPGAPDLEKAWDALADIRKAENKDMSEFCRMELDVTAASDHLVTLGEPKYRLIEESFTIGLSKSKAPAIIDVVDSIKSKAGQSISAHMVTVGPIVPEPIKLPEAALDLNNAIKNKYKAKM